MQKVSQVYISGPLTGVKHIASLKATYEALGELCREANLHPIIPHTMTDPLIHAEVPASVVYESDRNLVRSSDLVIAYTGIPSIGVGQEIEIARENNIPVILWYETGKVVSRMVRGSPIVIAEIRGTTIESIFMQLRSLLTTMNLRASA